MRMSSPTHRTVELTEDGAGWNRLAAEVESLRGRLETLEAADRKRTESITVIVFSGDMDRAQAAFNIANGAAALGVHATLFFTFWGLSLITRPRTAAGVGVLRRGFRLLHRPGTGPRPLSRFNLGGVGPRLFGRLMRQSHLPTLEEQLRMAHAAGVKLVACTVTMGLLGIQRKDVREEVQSFAGVVTYLTEARAAGVSLFI